MEDGHGLHRIAPPICLGPVGLVNLELVLSKKSLHLAELILVHAAGVEPLQLLLNAEGGVLDHEIGLNLVDGGMQHEDGDGLL